MKKIAFIGLGHMGIPMALCLIKHGYMVKGYDNNPTACEAFKAEGGSMAPSLSDAVHHADVVISMLQTGDQVRQLCLGSSGLYELLAPETLHIDCSTIDIESVKALHQAAREKRIDMIDAPVSGGVNRARSGTLTFMVGAQSEIFLKAKPFLLTMGEQLFHTGSVGSGQAAKVCNNMILGISMIAVSEAFVLSRQLGLTDQILFDVVTHSSGQCFSMSQYVPVPDILPNVPANNDYAPGFAAAMMLKDLLLSQKAAENVDVRTPLGAHATALYQQLVDEGNGAYDFSAIIRMIEQ